MNLQYPVLFVSWRSPETRTIYPVGRLVYREDMGLYEFAYIEKAREAAQHGFLPFLEFPDFSRIYLSDRLFPLFSNRVLQANRPDFGEYTGALGLSAGTANPMVILARTGGRRETDQIEMFPLPLPDKVTGAYVTHLLLRGIRYMQPGVEDRISRLKPNERLFILRDVQNEVDPTAIAVRTGDFALLGFLPAYITRDIWQINQSCPDCHVFVERVNLPPVGVHHRLLCRVEGCWPPDFFPYTTAEYQTIPFEATDLKQWIDQRLDRSPNEFSVTGSVTLRTPGGGGD